MDTITVKGPKKIELGKRLAEYNRKKREEQLKVLSTEVQEGSKMTVVLPILVLTVVGAVSTYWYFQPTKKQPTRPKILSRLEKI